VSTHDPKSPLPEDLRAAWESMTPEERDTLVYERALYRAQTERLQRELDDLRAREVSP
jgi:hypothetical protein